MTTKVLIPTAGVLSLGTTPVDVTCQILSATVRSSTPEIQVEPLCGTVIISDTTHTRRWLDLEYLQDWSSGGISTWLKAHAGQSQAFVWTPTTDGNPSATGTITVVEPSFGGTAGQPATDTISLPLVGSYTVSTDT